MQCNVIFSVCIHCGIKKKPQPCIILGELEWSHISSTKLDPRMDSHKFPFFPVMAIGSKWNQLKMNNGVCIWNFVRILIFFFRNEFVDICIHRFYLFMGVDRGMRTRKQKTET